MLARRDACGAWYPAPADHASFPTGPVPPPWCRSISRRGASLNDAPAQLPRYGPGRRGPSGAPVLFGLRHALRGDTHSCADLLGAARSRRGRDSSRHEPRCGDRDGGPSSASDPRPRIRPRCPGPYTTSPSLRATPVGRRKEGSFGLVVQWSDLTLTANGAQREDGADRGHKRRVHQLRTPANHHRHARHKGCAGVS